MITYWSARLGSEPTLHFKGQIIRSLLRCELTHVSYRAVWLFAFDVFFISVVPAAYLVVVYRLKPHDWNDQHF